MNYGFRLVYHKDIEWTKELEAYMVKKINAFTSEGSYKERHKSGAYYRRGIFGKGLNVNFEERGSIIYTFKRLVTTKRIFGIVPLDNLVGDVDLNQCMCAEHRGGQKVTLDTPYSEDKYITVFETGEIKG